jgi:putative chitinase
MAQIDHESGLKPISENLNYSSKGLNTTFKKYFPTIELANLYQRQPQKIANKVYANRMGNGDEASGHGFLYRGRGFLQITGKDNYTMLSKDTRIDFLNNPDLLLQEANALIGALWFWNKNNLNNLADKNDIIGITKKINGGLNGIEDRKLKLKKYL